MDLLLAKAICIFAFVSVATFGCSIPYLIGLFGQKQNIEHEKKVKNILSNLNCFGSGFIFSIVMFHLLPETIMIVSSHKDIVIFNTSDADMKTLYIFFFVFIGFCVQLALEYVLPVDSNYCCVANDDVKSMLNDNFSKTLVKGKKDSINIDMHSVSVNEDKYHHACDSEHFKKKQNFSQFLHVLTLQSFFLTVSLAVHSCNEGMIVGMSDDVHFVFINSFCILSHKWIAGVTVALSLNQNNISKNLKTILLVIFIFSSPLGIILGHLIQSSGEKLTCIINAISIGSLLFIGCEILLNEIKQKYSRKVRLTKWLSFCCSCVIAFFLIIATVRIAPHHHH
ncbi:transporter protein, putative [Plasmodium malariae]|uniref:Transporter protein, putative n=1 Tax=Plasmodium malariae TaxID=5858 RepID=A0A1D3SN73_PLAMA|nr:transporter protein, putative [Plasmodium malariae]SCO93284.1 transporter protein, putative [Plasmodium malariae]